MSSERNETTIACPECSSARKRRLEIYGSGSHFVECAECGAQYEYDWCADKVTNLIKEGARYGKEKLNMIHLGD